MFCCCSPASVWSRRRQRRLVQHPEGQQPVRLPVVLPDGGESSIVLDHNEFVGNNTGDWESKIEGCGCTGGGKFWDVRNVRVTNNYVHDNSSVALWAGTNDNNFLFEGNWIENNDGHAIFWEISYNAAIRSNVIRHNLTVVGPKRIRSGDNFPDAAIYISESGGDARLPHDWAARPSTSRTT